MCIMQQNKGNVHPNIRDIELDYIAIWRARTDQYAIDKLKDPNFYAQLNTDITVAFKLLRPYFLDWDVLVVPYNSGWHYANYPVPKTEWEARIYLTGPHYPIHGVYFVVDKNDKGDQLYMAYCNREDGKERNKRAINNRRAVLGVDQEVLPETHIEKRALNHTEKSVQQLTDDVNALRRLIAAKKKTGPNPV
jgi:hypothetical protein